MKTFASSFLFSAERSSLGKKYLKSKGTSVQNKSAFEN